MAQKRFVKIYRPLAVAAIWLLWQCPLLAAQNDTAAPVFRQRTDANAPRDLQLLRDELNKATDVDGVVNPLGRFQIRNAERAQPARIEIGPSRSDDDASRKPTIDPRPSNAKPIQTIGVLPGPRYTIIQQTSPQIRNLIVDDFRPSRSIVDRAATLASANLPIGYQPGNYNANYQDIPGTGANPGYFSQPGGVSNSPNFSPNSMPILPDATIQPSLPFNGGIMPPSNIGGPVTYGTPLQNSAVINNPPLNYQAQPYYPSTPTTVNPGLSGVPLRSPSDNVMPSPQRYSPVVNGAPFVSPPPCQFDASYMVSPRVYRQAVDPCAQPMRGGPSTYAPSPYATQPGGSPFSYVPPTGMPYNNNGYNSGFRPLIGFGQSLANAHTGRGIIGQPVAYVEGQPVRNFIRYLFP